MKHIFRAEHSSWQNVVTSTVEITTDAVSLEEVVQEFKHYLLACGFHVDNINDYFYSDEGAGERSEQEER